MEAETGLTRPSGRLFWLSLVALLLELALIRWVASEVRIFAYYKNLVLIACFLGFGLGMHSASRRSRLGLSLGVVIATICFIAWSDNLVGPCGPRIVSEALSNFAGSITMADMRGASVPLRWFVVALTWTTVVFVACQVALFGYAQRIGALIVAFSPDERLRAYAINVAGSLAGVLAFSAASALSLPPIAWFVPAALGTVPLLEGGRRKLAGLAGCVALTAALWPAPGVIWSAYQKLEWTFQPGPDPHWAVTVNGYGYMTLRSFDKPIDRNELRFESRGLDRWRLPHTGRPDAASVLIVGAGGGNDVAAAIRAGAKRIVAVDIDREIVEGGRRHHPDHPYDDPRVEVVIDDARHYAETTLERFDLIVMSHLDSHEALSSHTNVRLDNYIYTVESLRTLRERLTPGGVLYLSFNATQPWVAERLRENLRLAFGEPPTYLLLVGSTVFMAHFFASDDAGRLASTATIGSDLFVAPRAASPSPTTDDWPFLFVERRAVPTPILWLTAPVLVAAVAFALLVVKRGGLEPRGLFDRHFFLLGAAFLLVEVHNVGRLARVFGTTWVVNAFVVSSVLLVILLATLVAARSERPTGGLAAYLALGALLAAGALVPIDRVLALPAGALLCIALYTAPLFFAGLIFAESFRRAERPDHALGANILGSVAGGFLESGSFVIGISGLLWIALVLYALSWPGRRAEKRT
jgi:SAM-dependent methyltransferase